jgi:hypothetical protein
METNLIYDREGPRIEGAGAAGQSQLPDSNETFAIGRSDQDAT